MMDVFFTLAVVVDSQVYTYVQAHKIVHIKCGKVFIHESYLTKFLKK